MKNEYNIVINFDYTQQFSSRYFVPNNTFYVSISKHIYRYITSFIVKKVDLFAQVSLLGDKSVPNQTCRIAYQEMTEKYCVVNSI